MSNAQEGSIKYGGGPHGVGDPDDLTLRKVEIEILIPQKMRDNARRDKCAPEVEAFSQCAKKSGLAMIFTCRDENNAMKKCLTDWYENQDFRDQCTNEYLAERSEFRRTGITKKTAANIRELRAEIELEKKLKKEKMLL